MDAISITNLKKGYKNFNLDIKDLTIKSGYITGFIGPNGSGKTTTIKSILGLIKPTSGEIKLFEKDPLKDEKIKDSVAYVGGVSGFLEENKLKYIKKSISSFYSNWDEELYKKYINKFNLDEDKQYIELSKGQQKQFELSIAFAHHPKIIIMDEPTSNLDPLIRNELIELLQENMEREETTVFYSTHITSDLDKSADYIVFIDDGKIILQDEKDELLENHVLVKGKKELLDSEIRKEFISLKENPLGFEGLITNKDNAYEIFGEEAIYEKCSLEDILVFYTRRD
ncbi:UNVERIFIED_ORG: sodium ABC transporter ATP-binding protein [Clostridium botulinum]|uniref:ABC transporter ATP-binding protein n=1 Tax=Clostridium botulinum TaxID=1491 RepID=UPI000174E5DC|nr:ABC transporter ATP-binding protein [Clostridium botulinum]ACD53957.1 ABC transporter, ATP-binding protein [Clostridium botulinum E3 str. Alaska E43]AJF29742.1 sodium ABC transporter ATP-binding protein [Clostridium botulinum]AJF32803.1 sodium ABC transporter ATP-binding protein [Clostridium botulinum]MBN1071203.1 ABC transporter ATP-binding protein [Clostridium botulinum]MBN1074336.1 ABC transporter ATP-binding protein [Clostridium botulinum]